MNLFLCQPVRNVELLPAAGRIIAAGTIGEKLRDAQVPGIQYPLAARAITVDTVNPYFVVVRNIDRIYVAGEEVDFIGVTAGRNLEIAYQDKLAWIGVIKIDSGGNMISGGMNVTRRNGLRRRRQAGDNKKQKRNGKADFHGPAPKTGLDWCDIKAKPQLVNMQHFAHPRHAYMHVKIGLPNG